MIVIAQQNDTIDSICWRYLGRTADVVEQVLLLNPNLADMGIFLPIGTKINLPTINSKKLTKTEKLWG